MAIVISRVPVASRPEAIAADTSEAPANELPSDYRNWRRRALVRQKSLLNMLGMVTPTTGHLRTRRLQQTVGRYLASTDMRLLALRRAMSRDCSENRCWEQGFYARWLEYRQGLRSMAELHPAEPLRESCFVHNERKRNGGTRRLWKFGPCMTARQLLVVEVLKAIYARRAWSQMIFAGGLSAGVADIKEALRNPELTHYAIVDVSGFFDNVDLRVLICTET